ncbi:MAG: hypothetical protein HKN76_08720 [Saprospiraceae bacterium]|nr:hypothetical protein [Saprospiraceae bacterium]
MSTISWFFTCFLFAFQIMVSGQSDYLSQLKNSEHVERAFYFYPSTLRVLNPGDDPHFYKVIRGIKKVAILRMDNVDPKIMPETIRHLMTEEAYVDLMSMDAPGYRIRTLGKDEPMEYILFIEANNDRYIVSIQGQVNVLQLPSTFESLSQDDSEGNFIVGDLVSRIQGRNERGFHESRDSTRQDSIQNPEP